MSYERGYNRVLQAAGLVKEAYEQPPIHKRIAGALAPPGDKTMAEATKGGLAGTVLGAGAGAGAGGLGGLGASVLTNALTRGRMDFDPKDSAIIGSALGAIPGSLIGSGKGMEHGARRGYAEEHPIIDTLGLSPFK